MLPNLVAAVVFGGTLLAAALLYGVRIAARQAHHADLEDRVGAGSPAIQVTRRRRIDTAGAALGGVGERLHELITRSGSHITVGQLLLVALTLGVVGVALMGAVLQGPAALWGLLLVLIPFVWLQRKAAARSRKITEQLPDALDLMARALRSGHALSESMRMAAAELPAPISEELGPTAEEHRLGLELRKCLDGLIARIPDNFEIRMFASSVLLHRETGGNLIEILEQLADTVRERVVFEAKARAMTTEVRTSALILEALPFLSAFLITLVAPGYLLPLLEAGLGRVMLVGGMISLIIGIALMRRISRVEA